MTGLAVRKSTWQHDPAESADELSATDLMIVDSTFIQSAEQVNFTHSLSVMSVAFTGYEINVFL